MDHSTKSAANVNPKKQKILLYIDDDSEDIEFLKYALETLSVGVEVVGIESGVEALSYLQQSGRYADAPRPHVIFLDLSMPQKDGGEVLQEIKADKNLQSIPVVVFTSSDSKVDKALSQAGGANLFLTKPVGLEEYHKVAQALNKLI